MNNCVNHAAYENMHDASLMFVLVLDIIRVAVQELLLLGIIIIASNRTNGGRFSKLPG